MARWGVSLSMGKTVKLMTSETAVKKSILSLTFSQDVQLACFKSFAGLSWSPGLMFDTPGLDGIGTDKNADVM